MKVYLDVELFTEYTLQLARDAQKRSRLGRAGQAFFEAHFSWERVADTLLEAIEAREATRRPPTIPSSEVSAGGSVIIG